MAQRSGQLLLLGFGNWFRRRRDWILLLSAHFIVILSFLIKNVRRPVHTVDDLYASVKFLSSKKTVAGKSSTFLNIVFSFVNDNRKILHRFEEEFSRESFG